MMLIIGFIVYMVGSQPAAEAMKFNSVQECKETLTRALEIAEDNNVTVIKAACVQSS